MEKKEYVKQIKSRFSLDRIKEHIKGLKDKKVFIIGDAIIDEYHYTTPKGRAIKDPIMSADYLYHEVYAGGILAIANHISNFVDNVSMVSLIGEKNSRQDFINIALNKNVKAKFFVKKNAFTTVKRRYIDQTRNHKLFKIEYIDDFPISEELKKELIEYIKNEIPKHDITIVGDYGHGFIDADIARILEKYSKYLCLSVQTNSANYGFNLVTKYKNANFTSLDEAELKLALTDRFGKVDELIKRFAEMKLADKTLITLGNKGCIYINREKQIFKAPILTEKVVDTVGAGDAVFSIVSMLSYINVNDELVPFVSNCVGGIAVNIVCNKDSVTKEKLLDFINSIYSGVG